MFLDMTVAVLVKVYGGLVLATDSATTLQLPNGSSQVYNNADKIFQLHRKLPVGAMTWGLGQIGSASISTLAKDLRSQLMNHDPNDDRPGLDPTDYTVRQVAEIARDTIFPLFEAEFSTSAPPSPLNLLIVGYSAGQQAEAWLIEFQDHDKPPEPTLVAGADVSGYIAFAQAEAVHRLFRGIDPVLEAALPQMASDPVALDERVAAFNRQPVQPSMPFPDAIALAKFLVDVTAGYSHFLLGPDTVGGPVEVAGLSRHEGFKWISRKHYYSPDLNH